MDAHEIQAAIERALRSPATEYLTTQQAAAYLGVSKPRLEIWRCRGGGPRFSKIGRIVRYKRTDLDEFMREHAPERASS